MTFPYTIPSFMTLSLKNHGYDAKQDWISGQKKDLCCYCCCFSLAASSFNPFSPITIPKYMFFFLYKQRT